MVEIKFGRQSQKGIAKAIGDVSIRIYGKKRNGKLDIFLEPIIQRSIFPDSYLPASRADIVFQDKEMMIHIHSGGIYSLVIGKVQASFRVNLDMERIEKLKGIETMYKLLKPIYVGMSKNLKEGDSATLWFSTNYILKRDYIIIPYNSIDMAISFVRIPEYLTLSDVSPNYENLPEILGTQTKAEELSTLMKFLEMGMRNILNDPEIKINTISDFKEYLKRLAKQLIRDANLEGCKYLIAPYIIGFVDDTSAFTVFGDKRNKVIRVFISWNMRPNTPEYEGLLNQIKYVKSIMDSKNGNENNSL